MANSKGSLIAIVLYLTFVAGAYFLGRCNAPPSTITVRPDTVYSAASAKSAAVAETTIKTVTRFRTLFDTLPGDTIYVPRVQIESVLVRCEGCAEQLVTFKRQCDSTLYALYDSIFKLNRALAKARGRGPWYFIGGVSLGVLTCAG